MDRVKFSILIPYKQRLRNLEIVLAGLADQTMDRKEFEVIVGAMEYAPEYVESCRRMASQIDIISVLSADDWNVSRARNLALRQATGQVVITLDADVLLPPQSLARLYDCYFAQGQSQCVLGQVVGYVDSTDSDIDTKAEEYSAYKARLADLDAMPPTRLDIRFQVEPVLHWPLVWAGFVAIPLTVIREHGLAFDEEFGGWGAEDQEWGFRIQRSGTPIVRAENVYGLHLPHPRNTVVNHNSYYINCRHFLRKWPCLEVEIARAFGWKGSNERYSEIEREVRAVVPMGSHGLGVVRTAVDGRSALFIGVPLDSKGEIFDLEPKDARLSEPSIEILPIVGFTLPYEDESIAECTVLAPILHMAGQYRDAVLAEADRVTRTKPILSIEKDMESC